MASSNDPNMGLQYGWDLGEDGWNTGMDRNLVLLGALSLLSVISRTVTAAPATPADGDRYYVPVGATGVWSSYTKNIAVWSAFTSEWHYAPTKRGWQFRIEDEADASVYYDGTNLQDSVNSSGFITESSSYTSSGDVIFSSSVKFSGSHTADTTELATMGDVADAVDNRDLSAVVQLADVAQAIDGDKSFIKNVSGIGATDPNHFAILSDIEAASGNTTASNVGGFIGVFLQKTGADLEFKTLQSSDASVSITSNATDIDITASIPTLIDTFEALTDTPSFAGNSLKYLRVNLGETDVEAIELPAGGFDDTSLGAYIANGAISLSTTGFDDISLTSAADMVLSATHFEIRDSVGGQEVSYKFYNSVSSNSGSIATTPTGLAVIGDDDLNLEATDRITSSVQTSAMTGGTSDDYIATKKYVDDNAGGGGAPTITWSTISTAAKTAVANEGYINTYDAGATVTYTLPTYVGLSQGDKIIIGHSGDYSMSRVDFQIDPDGSELFQGFNGSYTFDPNGGGFDVGSGVMPMLTVEYSGSTSVGWIAVQHFGLTT